MHILTRRHVIATLSASAAVALCPAALTAQTVEWAGAAQPASDSQVVGYSRLVQLGAADTQVDVSALRPGDVAVIARPSADAAYLNTGNIQHIAVHRRTAEQVATAQAAGRAGDTPEYYVANLVCPHRGFAISITNDPMKPFACNKRGGRHGSIFDATGLGVSGASEAKTMSVPDHSLTIQGDNVVLTLS